jgi:hypothetical protein
VLYTQLQPYQVISAVESYIKKMEDQKKSLIKSKQKKTVILKQEDKEEATF